MRSIADTIARLAAAANRTHMSETGDPGHLQALGDFGPNPGTLTGFSYVPPNLPQSAPLVVVLHGCTQTAAGYDTASGWSRLADEMGFALLYPQQTRSNNANLCFNWFERADSLRGSGEVSSIHQMISALGTQLRSDRGRIFITGLSAGGAMTSSMLASYPEVFAGGAIIAGLPHGVANGMVQAFDRMRGHGLPTATQLQKTLRNASDHAGPWPKISIWHGGADTTVSPTNAQAIASQWLDVHSLSDRPSLIDQVDGAGRQSWRAANGATVIEQYIIPGMGHGTPIKAVGLDACGSSAPYMLDVGISSTRRIAQFWGLGRTAATPECAAPNPLSPPAAPIAAPRLHGRLLKPGEMMPPVVSKVIEDALRAAGLMK